MNDSNVECSATKSMAEDFADSIISEVGLSKLSPVDERASAVKDHHYSSQYVSSPNGRLRSPPFSPDLTKIVNFSPIFPQSGLLTRNFSHNSHHASSSSTTIPTNLPFSQSSMAQFNMSPPVVAEAIATPIDVTIVEGVTYNNKGYEICGALNKFNKPCQRIGRNCPFHGVKDPSPQAQPPQNSPPLTEEVSLVGKKGAHKLGSVPMKREPYKRGWGKDEHIRFLRGLQIHGKGCWKEISQIVGTRSPSQIQVHAHRYFLRQSQVNKNKKSIHDFTLENLSELDNANSSAQLSNSPVVSSKPTPPFPPMTTMEPHPHPTTPYTPTFPSTYHSSTPTYYTPTNTQVNPQTHGIPSFSQIPSILTVPQFTSVYPTSPQYYPPYPAQSYLPQSPYYTSSVPQGFPSFSKHHDYSDQAVMGIPLHNPPEELIGGLPFKHDWNRQSKETAGSKSEASYSILPDFLRPEMTNDASK